MLARADNAIRRYRPTEDLQLACGGKTTRRRRTTVLRRECHRSIDRHLDLVDGSTLFCTAPCPSHHSFIHNFQLQLGTTVHTSPELCIVVPTLLSIRNHDDSIFPFFPVVGHRSSIAILIVRRCICTFSSIIFDIFWSSTRTTETTIRSLSFHGSGRYWWGSSIRQNDSKCGRLVGRSGLQYDMVSSYHFDWLISLLQWWCYSAELSLILVLFLVHHELFLLRCGPCKVSYKLEMKSCTIPIGEAFQDDILFLFYSFVSIRQVIAPKFDEFSEKYTDAVFLKVSSRKEAGRNSEIQIMPCGWPFCVCILWTVGDRRRLSRCLQIDEAGRSTIGAILSLFHERRKGGRRQWSERGGHWSCHYKTHQINAKKRSTHKNNN